MTHRRKTRREALAAVALGSGAMASVLVPSAIAQAQDGVPLVPPEQIRELHRQWLQEAAKELGDTLALSREGLNQSLKSLADVPDLLKGHDNDVLRQMLDSLFNSKNLDKLLSSVQEIYRQTVDQLGDVARAIVETVVDSVEYARNLLKNLDYDIVTLVIAHDVRAAIEGAAYGSSLVAVWAPPKVRVAVAIVGAVAAGAASSIIGYHDAKHREQMRRDG